MVPTGTLIGNATIRETETTLKVKELAMNETPDGLRAVENLYEYAIKLGIDGVLRIPGVIDCIDKSRHAPAPVNASPVLKSDLFSMRMEDLRAFAVRIGIKGARHIQGGKAVLAARVNEQLATMQPDDPRLAGGESLLAEGPVSKPVTFNVDLSTSDKNLAKLITLLGTLPENILQAEFKYGREWGDGNLPHGWSDMDQLRYNIRFYPFHRMELAKRPGLPANVLECLKQDPHPGVRKAAGA